MTNDPNTKPNEIQGDRLPAPDMDTLRTTLQGKALKECWVCGDNRWSMPPGTNMIPAGAGTDGEIDFTLGISVVAVICKTCGLVRLHHEGRLLEMGHDDALR